MSEQTPFCETPAARAAFHRWRGRVLALGAVLSEADDVLFGLVASREVRLSELSRALARCRDSSLRLRLVAAERLAASDMGRALDLVERVYGAAAPALEEPLRATGTAGRVVAFRSGPAGGLRVTAQRVVAAVRARGALTKPGLRALVRGSNGDFLRGIKEALAAGALVRSGSGSKARPYRYELGPRS